MHRTPLIDFLADRGRRCLTAIIGLVIFSYGFVPNCLSGASLWYISDPFLNSKKI